MPPRPPSSLSSPPRIRGPVFAVGRRVSVVGSGGYPDHVALTDESGANPLANLPDGTEVEILAWRTSGSRGTRYRVRSIETGRDGWLAVASLRDPKAVKEPDSAGAAPSPTSRRTDGPAETGRRFGQR
jgi:hypothetical protein